MVDGTGNVRRWRAGWVGVGVALLAGAARVAAQDTRTVNEPVIPTGCTVVQAQQAISGGEPTSETTFDTTSLQSALNAAATCVELTVSGSNNAFLTAPITIPANVVLVVDGGVTVFGSRNPADYQVATAGVETCGTVGTAGNGCSPLIAANGANSGIMGYGIIDGRGQDKLLVNGAAASYSWWDQAGTAQNVSGAQNNPILVAASGANFTLYKITFRNSPMFHVKWSGNSTTKTGFTAWGVKVITPFTARNSDGIDPSGGNITITNASLSDGDDMVAVSAASNSQNITVQNTNTYSGHGISVGSYTQGNLSNMLVQNIMQMGTAADGNGGGLRIKTSQDRGGLVQNVTYQNICSANVKTPVYLSPYYNTNAGTLYPTFSNITYRNIHVKTEGTITLTGYANTGATVTRAATLNFDNFIVDTLKQTDLSPTPAYLAITEGPGPSSALLLSQTGTGVSYSGGVTNPTESPYPCNPATFQYLVGELYGAAAGATNLHSTSVTTNGSVTLTAMLQPAMSQVSYASTSGGGSYTGTAAPTAAVQFLEGTRVVGTASLGGNGTLSSVTLTGLTAGTHTYTAYYAGDATYTVPLSFGAVTVTVAAASTTTTTLTAVPNNVSYGTSTTLTAGVSSTASGVPTGSVELVADATTPLGSAVLSGSPASAQSVQVLGVGTHSVIAVYSGDANFAASTSAGASAIVTQATPVVTVSATKTSLSYGGSAGSGSTGISVMLAPSGAGSNPTGIVTLYDGTSSVGSVALNTAATATFTVTPGGGSHSYTATYGGDANYGTATGGGAAVSVTPAATMTTLSVSGLTAYGSTTTLTATLTPSVTGAVAASGSVAFYNGTTLIGSGTLSQGAVTAAVVLPLGADSLSAQYAGDANYAASSSTAVLVSTVAPVVLSSTPGSLSLAAGGSGSVSVSISPAGGFTGAVSLSCASPSSYVTCTLSAPSQTISGTTPASAMLTVQVAASLAQVEPPLQGSGRIWLAMLCPAALALCVRRRRRLYGALSCLLVLTLLTGVNGCSSSGGSTQSTISNLPPAGAQGVTVTAVAGIASATTSITVNVTN